VGRRRVIRDGVLQINAVRTKRILWLGKLLHRVSNGKRDSKGRSREKRKGRTEALSKNSQGEGKLRFCGKRQY